MMTTMKGIIVLVLCLSGVAKGEEPGDMKGHVSWNEPEVISPTKPVEWVPIPGGKFAMGTDSREYGFDDARPVHEVAIRDFAMSKTAVTVAQYAECVIKGGCSVPARGMYCNWSRPGRQDHPVNCVTWEQAADYALFMGARLPSEAEWEYAATSGGKNQRYPWGNDEASCDKAVMKSRSGYGCGTDGTMPVCSKPAGNTEQGLCDMTGNVHQWVQDKYQNSYKGAPVDGSAAERKGYLRVLRGGSFTTGEGKLMRSDFRRRYEPGYPCDNIPLYAVGFRIAR